MVYFTHNVLNNMFQPVFPANFRVMLLLQAYKTYKCGDTTNHLCTFCILVIETSPCIWPEHRPKHAGENTVITVHHKY